MDKPKEPIYGMAISLTQMQELLLQLQYCLNTGCSSMLLICDPNTDEFGFRATQDPTALPEPQIITSGVVASMGMYQNINDALRDLEEYQKQEKEDKDLVTDKVM